MKHRSEHSLVRITAFLVVLGVILLTVLAVSPTLHGWVHGHEVTALSCDHPDDPGTPVGDADHVCAVTLFASEATVLGGFCLLVIVVSLVRSVVLRAIDEFAIVRPRYWLVPAHAPPIV